MPTRRARRGRVRRTRASLLPMATLPTINEDEAVAVIDRWIDRVAEWLTSEQGRQAMREQIRSLLRSGAIGPMTVIEHARLGHADSDQALREHFIELTDAGEKPGAALTAYCNEFLLRGPVRYPRGRNPVDTWTRDIVIFVLVDAAVTHYRPNLSATRNPASKRPSACDLVAQALAKRGHKISERRVKRIWEDGVSLRARLAAGWKPSWLLTP
jgi:hypothetical protein